MGADISRVRFDPLEDFGGLVIQQGRVLLDADFNDYVAILDRRLRAETSDLTSFGPDPDHAGVSWVPQLTTDAFRVTASGGTFTIGRGRMYVDGLLAENHGVGPLGFDPLLAEATGTVDTPYDQQPYWKTPDPLPSGGPHLAYLDVWQREVTHLENPDLVEIAVGVDSTARLQTVWQVRVLPNVGTGACAADDDEIPGWLDVIQPSAGRLTTDTVEVDPVDDPCELPPSGGYRGRENQTYRIEIHDGGAPGTATFKWSRDNGSVAMPVIEMISPTELRLATLGRDDVLRISTGDWVEILDDHRELDQQPGVMRKVTVNEASRTIEFTDALPADLQPAGAADAAARHFRARRWDQAGVVLSGAGSTLTNLDDPTSNGLITVPALGTTQAALEHGIVASFAVAGPSGVFRSGDHWVFAARTADTSVEILESAPPNGIHHHYARLGTVTFPSSQTDCRRLWPPISTGGDGCADCTVCVTVESHSSGSLTLQAAIDLIGATGGTICLAPGIYDVGAGVTIDGARSLRIRGQGLATVLVARGNALTVTSAFGITIEDLSIVSGSAQSAAVAFRNVVDATLQDTAVLSYGSESVGSAAVSMSGVALAVAVRRNVLVGRVGVNTGGEESIGVLGLSIRIEDNIIGGIRGIDLGRTSLYLLSCRMADNEILAGDQGGIVATGLVAPGGSLDVVGHKIVTTGTGISVGGDAVVADNTINGLGDRPGQDGIVITESGLTVGPGWVRITGNRVHGRQGCAIALRTPVRTFMVKQNIASAVGSGIVIDFKGGAERAIVDNNDISQVMPSEMSGDSVFGIAITNARSVDVIGNTVSRVGLELIEGSARLGILSMGCPQVRIAGNVVQAVGPTEGFLGFAAGIAVTGPFEEAAISDNSVRFDVEAQTPGEGRWWGLLLVSSTSELNKVGGGRAVVALDGEALVFTKGWAYLAAEKGDHAAVSTNILAGGGSQPTCHVEIRGDVVADANQCTHLGDPVAMLLAGGSVVAASNRIRGGKSMLVIQTNEDRFSAVGNLAAAGTHLGGPGAGLPGPWDALNPTVF
jgi:hypothetical protein